MEYMLWDTSEFSWPKNTTSFYLQWMDQMFAFPHCFYISQIGVQLAKVNSSFLIEMVLAIKDRINALLFAHTIVCFSSTVYNLFVSWFLTGELIQWLYFLWVVSNEKTTKNILSYVFSRHDHEIGDPGEVNNHNWCYQFMYCNVVIGVESRYSEVN